jgi:hypothetical protein
MLRTHWEQGRPKKKKTLPTPTHHQKGKIKAHHECMLGLPIGCMKFLVPKLFVTVFRLG